jgi:integrase
VAERLTDQLVRNASIPATTQAFLWDAQIAGFGLRVTPGGAKSFIAQHRVNGRTRRVTIGSYPDWTVQAAREMAKELKREMDCGRDPNASRDAARRAPSMVDLWDRYEAEVLTRKAPRSQIDERIMWANIIKPRLGDRRVHEIAQEDIDDLHRWVTVERQTPVRANRTVEVLRRLFNLAVRWKWRTENPAVGIKRNAEERRHRYLSPDEISRLMTALDGHKEETSAAALKFLLLTGARRGEVLGATWEMFNLLEGIWTKPASFTKQRKLHRVPLSSPALSILQSLRERSASDYVFPGSEGRHLVDIKRTWVTVCRTAEISDCRIHDLRHSFASILASAGASLPIIGQMLGHTQASTTSRYAHLLDEPLRAAAEQVGKAVVSSSKSS